MAFLTDRASLKREFFRLTNTDALDDDLIEHDESSTDLEGLYFLLQQGYEDAQLHLIDVGLKDWWLATTASALTFSGSDPDRLYGLPDGSPDAKFLRLYGDHRISALHKANGQRWGREIPVAKRWSMRGDYYYLRNESLYLVRNASPPSDLLMDYVYRVPTLADGTTVDFPEPDRPLIVAFAAVHGMEQAWFPGDQAMERKLERNLERRKQEAWRRARRSSQPRMIDPGPMVGDHWFV